MGLLWGEKDPFVFPQLSLCACAVEWITLSTSIYNTMKMVISYLHTLQNQVVLMQAFSEGKKPRKGNVTRTTHTKVWNNSWNGSITHREAATETRYPAVLHGWHQDMVDHPERDPPVDQTVAPVLVTKSLTVLVILLPSATTAADTQTCARWRQLLKEGKNFLGLVWLHSCHLGTLRRRK